MLSEKHGKILDIIANKKNYTLIFDNFSDLTLSENTFTNHYLYINKEISYNDYDLLKQEEEKNSLLNYSLSLVSKKEYTEKEIYLKLKKKKAAESNINYCINYLKTNNFINDERYKNEFIFEKNNKFVGKNNIIRDLKQKGIIVDNIESDEQEKIKQQINILNKKYQSKNYHKKIDSIRNSLYLLGFNNELINEELSNYDFNYNKEDEKKKLELDYFRYGKLDNNSLIKKLLAKGYDYDLIKEVIKENR